MAVGAYTREKLIPGKAFVCVIPSLRKTCTGGLAWRAIESSLRKTRTLCSAGSRYIWAGSRERARAHAPPRPRPPITSTHDQHPLPPRPRLLRPRLLRPLRQAQRRPLRMLPLHLWRFRQRKTLRIQLVLPATPVPSRRSIRYEPQRAHGDLPSGAGAMAARVPTSPRALTPPSTIRARVHVWPTPDRRTPVLL